MPIDDADHSVPIRLPLERRVIHLNGDLDTASRDHCLLACTPDDAIHVTVDLSDVTFMDCSAYRTLMDAHDQLSQRHGSLEIRSAQGQPARLLVLMDELWSR